jgi:hypothetical protein
MSQPRKDGMSRITTILFTNGVGGQTSAKNAQNLEG